MILSSLNHCLFMHAWSVSTKSSPPVGVVLPIVHGNHALCRQNFFARALEAAWQIWYLSSCETFLHYFFWSTKYFILSTVPTVDTSICAARAVFWTAFQDEPASSSIWVFAVGLRQRVVFSFHHRFLTCFSHLDSKQGQYNDFCLDKWK